MWGNDVVYMTIVEAKQIRACNIFSSTSDVYCTAQLKSNIQNSPTHLYALRQTALIKKTLTPFWQESLCFNLSTEPFLDLLILNVFAKATLGSDKPIGRVDIPLTMLTAIPGVRIDTWFKLQDPRGRAETVVPGMIRLQMQFVPNGALNKEYNPTVPVPVMPMPEEQAQEQPSEPAHSNTAPSVPARTNPEMRYSAMETSEQNNDPATAQAQACDFVPPEYSVPANEKASHPLASYSQLVPNEQQQQQQARGRASSAPVLPENNNNQGNNVPPAFYLPPGYSFRQAEYVQPSLYPAFVPAPIHPNGQQPVVFQYMPQRQ